MSLQLEIDASQIAHLAGLFHKAQQEAPAAIGRAVRRTGTQTKTQVVRALTKQTGLKRSVVARAVVARASGQTYTLRSRGGNVSLKYFGARETRKGVSAAPWNERRVYAGAFIKGGFTRRVALKMGGHVFMRAGKRRLPIVKQKSDLFIPTEMVSGATRAAFLDTVRAVLPVRLQHEIGRILGGTA